MYLRRESASSKSSLHVMPLDVPIRRPPALLDVVDTIVEVLTAILMMLMDFLNVFNLRGYGEVANNVHAITRTYDEIYERSNGTFYVTEAEWRKATPAEIENTLNTKHDNEANPKNRYVLPASEDGVLHLRGVGTHPQTFMVNNGDKLRAPSLKQVCLAMEPDSLCQATDEPEDGDDDGPVVIDDAPAAPAAPVVAVVGGAASGASGVADTVEFWPEYTMGVPAPARSKSPGRVPESKLPICLQEQLDCDASLCDGGVGRKFGILQKVNTSVQLAYAFCIKDGCQCSGRMDRVKIVEVREVVKKNEVVKKKYAVLHWCEPDNHNHTTIVVPHTFVLTARK